MALQSFGSVDTNFKLDKIAEYLEKYPTVLKDKPSKEKPFRTIFVDAFAGTGHIERRRDAESLFDGDADSIIEGSATRALRLNNPFSQYVFVEMNAQKARALEKLKSDFPILAQRISIQVEDANDAVQRLCNETNWKTTRAVIFLDPFGNQVSWQTLEAIAQTQSIDLWYLFPSGLGVWRQISKDGRVVKEANESLDRMFGRTDWRDSLITRSYEVDLLGEHEVFTKEGDPNAVTEYMISLMKGIFKGGVLDQWLVLGSHRVHKYSLIFACSNPSPRANQLAFRLAKAILRSDKVGRRK
jgi:three-Cys-motif partner protein